MFQSRFRVSLSVVVVILMLIPLAAFAKSESDPVARMSGGGSAITFAPNVEHESLVMTVMLPDGSRMQRTFAAGTSPMFRLQDVPGRAVDGTYSYELRVVPRVAASVRQALVAAREKNDDAAIARIQHENGLDVQVDPLPGLERRQPRLGACNGLECNATDRRRQGPDVRHAHAALGRRHVPATIALARALFVGCASAMLAP